MGVVLCLKPTGRRKMAPGSNATIPTCLCSPWVGSLVSSLRWPLHSSSHPSPSSPLCLSISDSGQSLTRGRTDFLGRLPGRTGSCSWGRDMLCSCYQDDPLPAGPLDSLLSAAHTSAKPLPHAAARLVNKAGPSSLFLANRERAEAGEEATLPCQWWGWQRQESSSWAVWIGTRHHTGPAAGVPDGRPESAHLRRQLCLCSTALTIPMQAPRALRHT